MKAVKLMFNGVNQLALGTISATSDLLLKLPGVVLSEASNVINAGVGVASEFSEQRLVDKSVCVNSFGER